MKFREHYQEGCLVLPASLLFNFKELFNSPNDFLVWQFFYLQNTTKLEELAPSTIAAALGKSITEVNHCISNLSSQGLLEVKTIVLDGQTEILFDATPLFDKLDQLYQSTKEQSKTSVETNSMSDLVTMFEQEFGRFMTPIELEDLEKLKNDYSMEMIKAALRETVFSGKTNWRYFTAILRNWKREGLTTVRQIEEEKKAREQKQSKAIEVSDDFRTTISQMWSD